MYKYAVWKIAMSTQKCGKLRKEAAHPGGTERSRSGVAPDSRTGTLIMPILGRRIEAAEVLVPSFSDLRLCVISGELLDQFVQTSPPAGQIG
jgi:hypothetical protein